MVDTRDLRAAWILLKFVSIALLFRRLHSYRVLGTLISIFYTSSVDIFFLQRRIRNLTSLYTASSNILYFLSIFYNWKIKSFNSVR